MTAAEAEVVSIGANVLAKLVTVVAGPTVGAVAEELASAAVAILDAHATGAISADDAKVQLAAIPVERAKNNAAADEIVRERFHPGEAKP